MFGLPPNKSLFIVYSSLYYGSLHTMSMTQIDDCKSVYPITDYTL